MSLSITQTRTWTITQARYVTSKIAADLELVRTHYARPSVEKITDYAEEAAQLLAERYLGWVEYGFKRNGLRVFALKYEARCDGTLSVDDRPGRVPAGLSLTGAIWYSYLDYSSNYYALTDKQRQRLKEILPVQRGYGAEPEMGSGYWEYNRTYSSNGEGVRRQVFRPL
jgi:Bacterial HORMA domain family 1